MKDEYVNEHLLLALIELKDSSFAQYLKKEVSIEISLLSIISHQRIIDQNPEEKYQALEKYSRDLTKLPEREN